VAEVIFDIEIKNKMTNALSTLEEVHPMRYLFKQEIEFLCSNFNFKIQAHHNWMDKEKPTEKSWYSVFVLK
jgi:hypothetical protein